jgi:hypothetical protein
LSGFLSPPKKYWYGLIRNLLVWFFLLLGK